MLSFFVRSRLAYKPLPFFSWCPMKKFPEHESSSKTLRSGSSREKDSYTSSSSSLSPLLKTNFLENNSVTVAFFAAPRWWWLKRVINIFIILILIIIFPAFIYDSVRSLLLSVVSPGLFGNQFYYHHHHPAAAYDWKKYIR
mmetsp:Transcript_943/g.3451  ORF Transcript_943/g.3451 Transcript_943/m.3451 type:complete len:141 (-) Transcript_943:67-489(-)